MNKNVYQTKDLFEASYLYATNQTFLGLKEIGHKRYQFVFEDEIACRLKVDAYWSKKAVVNAKEFADSIRTLKDRIFQSN